MIVIIGQFLTFISYAIFWISRYLKTKRNLLLFDSISRFVAILSFIVLGTIDGIKNSIFVLVRNFISNKVQNKSKFIKYCWFLILFIILVIIYSFSDFGVATLCVFVCGVLNLYGNVVCDEQGIRLYGLLGSGFYAIFLLFSKNYTGFICELICAGVMLNSYIMYKGK